MANIITGIRIILCAALLFSPTFSSGFFAFYIGAGVSDMIDGIVARKTGTVSELGSRLDTIADIVFVVVCLIKVLPVLELPIWLYIWVGVIALIKVANIVMGYIRLKEFVSVHSVLNKVTGGLLFILTLTLTFIDVRYSGSVVSIFATIAAIHESKIIIDKRN